MPSKFDISPLSPTSDEGVTSYQALQRSKATNQTPITLEPVSIAYSSVLEIIVYPW